MRCGEGVPFLDELRNWSGGQQLEIFKLNDGLGISGAV
jgi:hypothetical protein